MVSEAGGHFGGTALQMWHPSECAVSVLSCGVIPLTDQSLAATKKQKTLQVTHTLEFGALCSETMTPLIQDLGFLKGFSRND